jgi:SAM-dependent methyltransferase
MSDPLDYVSLNRAAWNHKTPEHIQSGFYNMDAFMKGANSLNHIELELLGDLSGKSVMHLQCHFGQDTISLTRMGADATGVDFSEVAIDHARRFAAECGSKARFICCELYELPQHQVPPCDSVFSSYGTIGWLPDLYRWAAVVAHCLKPGGSFVLAEFHPVVWMYDDDFDRVAYPYFNRGPIVETPQGTYANPNAPLHDTQVMWNHSIADVLTALVSHNLELTAFREYHYSPYNCFRHTVEQEPGRYTIAHLGNRIPMVYALRAIKKM